jgi:hypothetical protein
MCFGGSQLETRSTGSASGTQTSGSSPRPIPRPDTSSPVYRVSQAVSTAASNLARDVSMGVAVFGKDREAGAEKLASQGYSKEKIDDYYARTDANIAAQQREAERLADLKEQGRSMQDQPGYKPPAASMMSAPTPTPAPAPAAGGGGATAPVAPPPPPSPRPEPIVPPKPVDTTTEGAAAPTAPDTGAGTTTAAAGVEEAKKLESVAGGPAEAAVADTIRKGRRSTIVTTPIGLLGSEGTRRRRSLIGGGLIS